MPALSSQALGPEFAALLLDRQYQLLPILIGAVGVQPLQLLATAFRLATRGEDGQGGT